MEQFKDILGYEGYYQISNLGNIKSLSTDKIMSSSLDSCGYPKIRLYKEYVYKTFNIHRLLAIHFISNPNGYSSVNHINGIKTDNRIDNLEWVTHKSNIHHAWNTNLCKPVNGIKHGKTRLTETEVIAIRADNRPYKEIAKDYDIKASSIGNIKNRRNWKHIP